MFNSTYIEVYKIAQWFKAGEVMWSAREEDIEKVKDRFEFVGNIAPDSVRQKYVNKSVSSLFNKGNQNPIRYFVNGEV